MSFLGISSTIFASKSFIETRNRKLRKKKFVFAQKNFISFPSFSDLSSSP